MTTHIYHIAELYFTLTIPSYLDVDELLPNMRGFRVEKCDDEPIFQAQDAEIMADKSEVLSNPLEESENDMGCVKVAECGNEYLVSVSYFNNDIIHYMLLSKDFSNVKLQMQWQDRAVGHSLNSLLRIAFAQAVIFNGGVSIHGSTVMLDGGAYLFLGASGTGKSTHSSLWRQTFDGCELLNDDNPTIRIVSDSVKIYGTPWSGKTPCYKNQSCRLAGVVRLQQAPENIYQPLQGIEAFVALLPGCMALRHCKKLYDQACDNLFKISERTSVGRLKCLPNQDAARLCYESLNNNINN